VFVLLICCAPAELADAPERPARDDVDELDEGSDPQDTAEEASADDALIRSVNIPNELACGETGWGVVTVQNTGTATWTREDEYKLGAIGDEDPLKVGDSRSWLPEGVEVAPGFEYAFEIELLGPADEGLYTTDWQMVHEFVGWFGEDVAVEVAVICEDEPDPEDLALPDMSHVVEEVAADHPDWLANSCQDEGGTWQFMDEVVDRLRLEDERWGYNWKRGNVGDPSQDVVDYHYAWDTREGSENVYIIDMIVGHCGDDPQPGWLDVTQATADAGTIGKWTGRGRF